MFLKTYRSELKWVAMTQMQYCSLNLLNYHAETGQFSAKRTIRERVQALVIACFIAMYITAVAYHLSISFPTMSKQDTVISGYWSYLGLAWTGYAVIQNAMISEVSTLLNGILTYEGNRKWTGASKGRGLFVFTKLLMWIISYCGVSIGPLILIGTIVFPDMPPFYNSWLWPRKIDNFFLNVGAKLLEAIMWDGVQSTACTSAILNLIIVGTGLLVYVNQLDRLLSWTLLSDFTRECQILQVLMAHYNATNAAFLIPFHITMMLAVAITSFTFSIKYASLLLEQPILLFLPYVAMLSFTFILGYGFVAGAINAASSRQLKKRQYFLLLEKRVKEKRILRRTLKQLAPFKIKFGGSNFFEMSTALVMLDFVAAWVVNLLLLDH